MPQMIYRKLCKSEMLAAVKVFEILMIFQTRLCRFLVVNFVSFIQDFVGCTSWFVLQLLLIFCQKHNYQV
jgi:hypothetical protein